MIFRKDTSLHMYQVSLSHWRFCSTSIIIHLPFYYQYQTQQKTTDPLFLCFPSPSIFSWHLPWVQSVQSSQKSNGLLWCTAFHSVTSVRLVCQRYSPELGKEQQRAHKGDNLSFSQTHPWKQLIFRFIHSVRMWLLSACKPDRVEHVAL